MIIAKDLTAGGKSPSVFIDAGNYRLTEKFSVYPPANAILMWEDEASSGCYTAGSTISGYQDIKLAAGWYHVDFTDSSATGTVSMAIGRLPD